MPLTRSFATQSPSGAAATSGRGAATGTAKKMGLFAVILLGINGIIGSGAFLLPQEIYKDAGLLLAQPLFSLCLPMPTWPARSPAMVARGGTATPHGVVSPVSRSEYSFG